MLRRKDSPPEVTIYHMRRSLHIGWIQWKESAG